MFFTYRVSPLAQRFGQWLISESDKSMAGSAVAFAIGGS
jgi:hypothetical protein